MLWLDTDAAINLAALGILGDLPDVLNVAQGTVYYLKELSYQVDQGRSNLNQDYSPKVAKRIAAFQEGASQAVLDDPMGVVQFAASDSIHSGEQILFAGAIEIKDSRVLTADVNALRGLATDVAEETREQITGRIILFEDYVRHAVCEYYEWDSVWPFLSEGLCDHREIVNAVEEAKTSRDSRKSFCNALAQSVQRVPGEVLALLGQLA